MDTRMLDVAIGLVLVIALTSLIVSTLTEIVSSFFQTRGDVLTLAICSLVGDNAVRVGPLSKRWRGSRPSAFTRELLAQPLLVAQAEGGEDDQRRPSYLQPDVFVSALLAHLQDLYTGGQRPSTPQVFVNALLARPTATGRDALAPRALVRSLASLVHGVEGDWPAYQVRLIAWYDSVTQRASGWFRRSTQRRLFGIGMLVACLMNINPLVIVPRLWNDGPLRAAFVGAAQQAVTVAAAASAASAPASAPSAAVAASSETKKKTKSAQAAASAASAPVLLQSLVVSARIDRLIDKLYAIGEEAVGERKADAGLQAQDTLQDVLQLKSLVNARRAMAQPGADPIRVLDASASIEDALKATSGDVAILNMARSSQKNGAKEAIEAPKRAASAGSAQTKSVDYYDVGEVLGQLTTALRAERNVLLANLQEGAVISGNAPSACLAIADPTGRRLCETTGGLEELPGQNLPIGWAWRNWPDCDLACALRHRPDITARIAQTVAYAVCGAASGPSRDLCQVPAPYQRALQVDADPPASSPYDARQLKRAYLVERAQAASAALTAHPVPSVWTQMREPEALAGLPWALVGWAIIGIASMLGAPFWFDLLGTLIKVRNAGAKPGEDKDKDAKDGQSGSGSGRPGGTLQPSSTPSPSPSPPGSPGSAAALNDAEKALGAQQIQVIQRRVGLDGSKVTGVLDADTRLAVQAWQASQGEAATGELTQPQVTRLLAVTPSTAPAPPPPAPASQTRTPLRADGSINVLKEDEVRALYGSIATSPRPGHPGWVDVDSNGLPGQAQRVLVAFEHALLNGRSLRVHERALPHFKAVFDAIAAAELGDRVKTCETLAERHIGFDPTRPLSRHTWGIAIDVNSAANPQGKPATPSTAQGSVAELVPLFEKEGFAWGGRFTTLIDPMHFELALRAP